MGLGTGRRGMKSPPLLIAVLLACVFVLGINYWITSSRYVELQNHVMELEGRVRRAAAERGAVEMKKNEYEDMLAKQKKQIDTIQSLHSTQMQNIHSQCNSEKESLVNNITNKDNVIQVLQVQLSGLNRRLEESKLEFKELQESQTKKLSYELAQCGSKISEVKEQCEERLRKAGVKDANAVNEHTEKTVIEAEKLKPTTKQQSNLQKDDEKEEAKSKNNLKSALIPSFKDDKKGVIPPPEKKEETNDLVLTVDEKKPIAAPKPVDNKNVVQEPGNQIDPVQVPGNQINPDNVNVAEEENEPKVEDAEYQEANKENEVERENLINLDAQQEDEKDLKLNEQEDDAENPNEYNGDEANVAESEAEKQAQLNDKKPDLKDNKIHVGLNGQAAEQEAEDNPT